MHGLLSIDVQHKIMQVPPWIYPRGVGPTQIVEGHNVFSTKWTGLATGISTKWGEQRIHYIKWIALASWNSWVLLPSAPQLSQWKLHHLQPSRDPMATPLSTSLQQPEERSQNIPKNVVKGPCPSCAWIIIITNDMCKEVDLDPFQNVAGWKKVSSKSKSYPSIPRKTTHTFRIHTFWMKIPSLSWRIFLLGFADAIYQDLPSGDGI